MNSYWQGEILEKLTCPLESLLGKLTCPRESTFTGEGGYSARIVPTRTNLRNLTHIEMQGIDTRTGEIKATERFDIRPFRI